MHGRVWHWYRQYCFLNGFLNLALTAVLITLLPQVDRLVAGQDEEVRDALAFSFMLTGSLFCLVGLVFGILNFLLVSRPRTQAWYTAHLVNIVLGIGSVCLTIPLVFLLLAWVRPGFKEWFLNPEPLPAA